MNANAALKSHLDWAIVNPSSTPVPVVTEALQVCRTAHDLK